MQASGTPSMPKLMMTLKWLKNSRTAGGRWMLYTLSIYEQASTTKGLGNEMRKPGQEER